MFKIRVSYQDSDIKMKVNNNKRTLFKTIQFLTGFEFMKNLINNSILT